jgi:ParB/RepB/Spo0J family partition protein
MQLCIAVPQVYRKEEVDISRIEIEEMEETAYRGTFASVSSLGMVLQNVMLVEEGKGFRVVFGKRRILSARKAGHERIMAVVFQEGTPEEVLATFVLVENMNRKPNPASEAEALSIVMKAYDWTSKDVAAHLGIPVSHIKARLQLLNLIPEFFAQVRSGAIAFGLAKRLCKLSEEAQRDLLVREKLTVEDAEGALRKEKLDGLIPPELFDVPLPKADVATVESLLGQAATCLERAISVTDNGNKGALEAALTILKEVNTHGA